MTPIYINTNTFTQASDTCTGVATIDDLVRSDDLLVGDATRVEWTLKGEQNRRVDGGVEQYLGLQMHGVVLMQCLRCLSPVEIPININRQFRLAKDEQRAATLDREDELVDAIVGSQKFDIMELIEDELIMDLPYSPKHSDCVALAFAQATDLGDSSSDAGQNEDTFERPNPFSALAQLKTPNQKPNP